MTDINVKNKEWVFYPFTNDLMFCYVLSNNPDLAKELIEIILGIKVDHVEVIVPQKILNYSIDSRSVRFDVYMKNDTEIFDVEMQSSSVKDLPKRMRYYQAAITCDDLNRGEDYNDLKNSYVIFICKKDPFHVGRAVYRFRMKEDDDVVTDYDDGTYDVVINCEGNDTTLSEELRNLLSFLKDGKPVDNFTHRIQNEVEQFNQDPSFRRTAMTLYEKIRDASRQSKEEGLQEGLEIGIQKGDYDRLLSTVDHLLSNGSFASEEEACIFLGYDFNEYQIAKKQVIESSD